VKRTAKLALVATVALGAVVLAGCGGGSSGGDNGVADKTADEIADASLAAAKSADSVYINGSVENDGDPLEIDMHIVDGEGGAGHLSTGGQSFDIVRAGDKVYIKGDDAFWKGIGGDAAVQLFHGKWLVADSSEENFAPFLPLTDIEQFFDGVLGEHGTLEKGDTTEVDGTKAVAIEEPDGTVYVATEGEPYPLKVEGGDDKGSISFDDWNEGYDIEVPEDAVDFAQLRSMGGG
jgi:hypothetical protein